MSLDRLQERLGHRFVDPVLLESALTHRSYANERGQAEQNERLEFLGDAVLGLVAADWLFRHFPEQAEGELALAKAVLVSERVLASYAEAIELGAEIRLGVGESRSGGGSKGSLRADALEALFGAIFLDGGLAAAASVIERYLGWAESHAGAERKDAKTELQEWVQGRGWALPAYRIVEERGPDHDKLFVCELEVEGEIAGRGRGRTKKEAQQQAAGAALDHLDAQRQALEE